MVEIYNEELRDLLALSGKQKKQQSLQIKVCCKPSACISCHVQRCAALGQYHAAEGQHWAALGQYCAVLRHHLTVVNLSRMQLGVLNCARLRYFLACHSRENELSSRSLVLMPDTADSPMT